MNLSANEGNYQRQQNAPGNDNTTRRREKKCPARDFSSIGTITFTSNARAGRERKGATVETTTAAAAGTPTAGQLAADYPRRKSYGGLALTTITVYKSELEKYGRLLASTGRDVASFAPATIGAYQFAASDRGVKPGSIRSMLKIVV